MGTDEHDEGRPEVGARDRPARRLLAVVASSVRTCRAADRRVLDGSIALQVLAGAATAGQLLLARRLLEEVVAEGGDLVARAGPLMAALVVTTAALGAVTVIQATLTMVLAEAVSMRQMGRILDVAVATEPIAWEDPAFHDRLERARSNAASRPLMAVSALLGAISGAAGTVGVAVALLSLDPLLVPLAAIAAVPAWLASTINSRRYHRFSHDQAAADRRRSYLMHVLTNRELAKELRVYRMEQELRRRHDELYQGRLEAVRSLARGRRRTSVLAAMASAAGTAIALTYLLVAIDSGRLDLPSAGTALFSLLFLGQRLRTLVANASQLYEAGLFLDEIDAYESLADDPGVVRPDRPAEQLAPFAHLAVRDLRFSYPGSEGAAVDGVDLDLRAGEVVALVGENGSGKTTLAKLLAGLYRPDGGSLRWDEIETTGEDPARLRRSVAVVFQDHAKLQLTAADNVGLGDATRLQDRAAIEAAGILAGADEVVRDLPEGWDHSVGRIFAGGVDLSGGQWQRLALARALFRDAPLLILDEPSSALDPRAEAALFEQLRTMVAGRAALFISHRFSTVRLADRIYVMAEGAVVEVGTHPELMALDGVYAELYRLQRAGFDRTDEA